MKASERYMGGGVWTIYIKYKGVWDMEDLYISMIDYLRERKFRFQERVYKHKRPSPFGVERQYSWTATRHEDEYLDFQIDVYIHTYDANDEEIVMSDGSHRTITKGRMLVEFRGNISYDYEGNFEKNAFYAQLRNFFHKYIIKKKFEQVWWDQLWYREIHPLHNMVKNRLKMQGEGFEHRYWTGVHA